MLFLQVMILKIVMQLEHESLKINEVKCNQGRLFFLAVTVFKYQVHMLGSTL